MGVRRRDFLLLATLAAAAASVTAAFGQAVPDGGLVSQAMTEPAKVLPLNSLTPTSWKSLVSPSIG